MAHVVQYRHINPKIYYCHCKFSTDNTLINTHVQNHRIRKVEETGLTPSLPTVRVPGFQDDFKMSWFSNRHQFGFD